MAAADTAKMIVELDFKSGKFTAGLKSADKSLSSFEKRVGKLGSIASKGMANAARNIERGIALGAAAAAGAMVYAVNAAIDWESAMAGVNKTIEATPIELKAIEEGLIAISNKTGAAATDLAGIAETAGALGIAKADILSFTETVSMIGQTTNVSVDEAATALGQLGNVLALTGDDYDNFAATLVDLGNKGASTEAQILEIARRSGSAAKLFGLAKDETLGWSAAAANLGMNEELAGTSIQKLFTMTLNNFARGENKMAEFLGMTDKAMKKAFGKDASGLLASFIKKLAALPKDARLEEVQSFFGKGSGINRLVLGLADSYERNLAPALRTSADAWDENTAAAEEFAKRQATTQSQINRLQQNLKNAAVTIGTNLLPMVNELATDLTGWISSHQNEVKQFGKDLAAGIKDAVKWARSLNWNAITAALQAGVGFAKGLIQAFLMAPPWLQAFLAGGFVANKFTGGMITGLAGELGKMVLTRGNTPATPMFVKEVGIPGLGGKGGLPVGALPGVGGAAAAVGGGAALLAAAGTAAALLAGGLALYKGFELLEGARTQEAKNRPVGPRGNLRGFTDAEADRRGRVGSGRGDASTAKEVKRLGDIQALAARITAAGGKATADRIAAIMEKNVRATESGDSRVASRIDSLTGAVRAIKIAPVINVNPYVGVTIRNVATTQRIATAYGIARGSTNGDRNRIIP